MDDCCSEVTDKVMIRIIEISKYYGKKTSLQEVTLSIEKGEVYGLLGPNGAGKSTLLSILATVSKPDNGSIEVNGYDIEKQTKLVREQIGYVPQDVALWEHLTVKDNFIFWSKFSKQKISEKELYNLCSTVHLQDKWNEKVSRLSGGMKRKLNIAVALIHNPDVLLMDEPTVGIDIQSKLEINQYIRELARLGKTVVYTTHDMSEILYLCDRIGILMNGYLKFSGTMEDAREMAKQKGISPKNDEELIYFLLQNDKENKML